MARVSELARKQNASSAPSRCCRRRTARQLLARTAAALLTQPVLTLQPGLPPHIYASSVHRHSAQKSAANAAAHPPSDKLGHAAQVAAAVPIEAQHTL
jgi:hypothetical protein